MFASRFNSEAEQRAILNAIVDTFDATEVLGAGPTSPPGGNGTKPPAPEHPTATGLERARQLAAQAVDYRATLDEPARPNWDQPVLWDVG